MDYDRVQTNEKQNIYLPLPQRGIHKMPVRIHQTEQ